MLYRTIPLPAERPVLKHVGCVNQMDATMDTRTVTTLDDSELVRACMAGDDDAFDELVKRTRGAAYSLAFRYTQDAHTALDVVQEAYIKLYNFLPKWNFSCRAQTWLYRVATNLCIDQRRRNSKRLILMEDWTDRSADSIASNDVAPGHDLQRAEWRAEIDQAILALPERMQAAFRMKYVGGLSYKEIAAVQECSVGTVKAAIFQAASKLRLQFSKQEIIR